MAEYGGSPKEIAEQWTPGQILYMAGRIRRRHALRDAAEMDLAYVVAASARSGKKGFEAFQRVVRDLRREGGLRPKGTNALDLARVLGLRIK
jgi:hypothetical protein